MVNGRLDATLNYYEPDMLLNIENCGEGKLATWIIEIYPIKFGYVS